MNIINKIFGDNNEDIKYPDTDIHSHIIPAIDDGSPNMQTSIELIKELKKLGFKKLTATPHIMADYYCNTPEIIKTGYEKLKDEIRKNNINIDIDFAAEYHIDYLCSEINNNTKFLTLKNNHLLFELSFFGPPPNLFEIVFELQIKNYKLILAHPERYSYFHSDIKNYEKFKDRGILFQININSLTGHYSKQAQKMAEKLIKENMVELIATDLHNMQHINLLKKAKKNKYLKKLLDQNKLLNYKFR